MKGRNNTIAAYFLRIETSRGSPLCNFILYIHFIHTIVVYNFFFVYCNIYNFGAIQEENVYFLLDFYSNASTL